MALATEIKKIKTARKKYDDALRALSRRKIAKALGALLPDGFALVWEQSTPGFNDGEPCTLSRNPVRIATVRDPEAIEAEALDSEEEPTEDEVAAEDAEQAECDDAAENEISEEQAYAEAATEDDGDDEPENDSSDEEPASDARDFSCDDASGLNGSDRGVCELVDAKVSTFRWCGGPDGKALAAIKAAWKLVDDDAIMLAAFGDGDGRFVIRSGGKIEEYDYSCGY